MAWRSRRSRLRNRGAAGAGSRCEPSRVPTPGCPASDGMPASSDPTHARNLGKPLRPRRPGGLPTTEQPTDPPGLEGERVADVLERERPAHVGRLEPVCRLTKATLRRTPGEPEHRQNVRIASSSTAAMSRSSGVRSADRCRSSANCTGSICSGTSSLGSSHSSWRSSIGRMPEQLECHCDGYAFGRPAAPFAEALHWRRTTGRHRCRNSGMPSLRRARSPCTRRT